MNDNALLLPQVLETLSAKPNKCETMSNLCNELEEFLCSKHPNTKPADAKKRIKQILDVGQALGVLSIGSDNVKMTLNMKDSKKQKTPVQSDDDGGLEDWSDHDVDEPPVKSSRSRRESATVLTIKLSSESIPLTEADLDYIFNDSPRPSGGPSQSKRRPTATQKMRSSRLRKRPY